MLAEQLEIEAEGEGALQSAHVDRRRTGRSDWPAVVQIYDALLTLSGSPVIAINRALALAQVRGADVALAALDDVATDKRLQEYQPYWAARAELLAKVGARADAHGAYAIAIGLERDPAVPPKLVGAPERAEAGRL